MRTALMLTVVAVSFVLSGCCSWCEQTRCGANYWNCPEVRCDAPPVAAHPNTVLR